MVSRTDLQKEELRIREELTRLQLARLKLNHFIAYTDPAYKEAKHQMMMMEKLEQVERFIATKGKEGIGRLIINIPPRHAKTYTCAQYFPSWVIGRNPNTRTIIASYGASLAEKSSRELRKIVESPAYQKVFGVEKALKLDEMPIMVDPEGRSIQSWEIKDTLGGVVAVGVDGPVLGRAADLFVIDDAHKDRNEAESELMRERVWDWFVSAAYSRMQRGGAIIIIMQRWHEDDLVGRLLSKQPEKWDTLVLPAIALDGDPMGRKRGEALWPSEFPIEALEDKRALMPPRDWNSMYQQEPSGADGDVFKREWFTYAPLPHPDEISHGFQVWDCAMSEKQEGDYSACCTAYVTRSGLFIADMYRGHLSFPDLKDMMESKFEYWSRFFRLNRLYIEDKVAGTSVLQSLKKDTHLPVIGLKPESELGRSKLQRAYAATGYIHSGRVTFLQNASWLSDVEDELLKFPRGKNDDLVDSLVYAVLQVKGGGQPPRRVMEKEREEDRGRSMSMLLKSSMNRHNAIIGEL